LARLALGAFVLSCAVATLARAFRGVRIGATWSAIAAVGPSAPLMLAPFIAAMVVDALGVQFLLRPLGRAVPLAQIVPIRIATEALHLTAPAGFLVADSAAASLLDSRCGVPVAEGAMVAFARRWLVMRSHAAYVLLGAAVGGAILSAVSARYLGGPWLGWAVAAASLVPLLMSQALGEGFRGRGLIARMHAAASRAPWRWLREHTSRWREGAVSVDDRLASIGVAHAVTWSATGAFFACWLLEAIDTAIVLWLVGAPLDIAFAMAAEVGISLLRSAGNVVPAGLGVQDAGYATLLPAMGVAPDACAAFVVLKRGKELLWIALGYALLAVLRKSESASPDSPALPSAATRA